MSVPTAPRASRYLLPASLDQAFWWQTRRANGATMDQVSLPFRLRGPLDVAALVESLRQVVRRHEALRTSVTCVDGSVVQVVDPTAELEVPVDDLAHLASDEKTEALEQALQEQAHARLELESELPVHVRVLRLDPDEHVLLLTLHHVVCDAWSVGIVLRELNHLYAAARRGQRCDLPEPPIQFGDFTSWQAEWLRSEASRPQREYWAQRLAGSSPRLDVPVLRARETVLETDKVMLPLRFPAALSTELATAARRVHATLQAGVLAVLAVTVHTYGGQDDLLVAATRTLRTAPETRGVVGLFLNWLLLRVDLGGDPSFEALLERQRDTVMEAHLNADLPFLTLADELGFDLQMPGRPGWELSLNFIDGSFSPMVLSLQDVDVEPLTHALHGRTQSPTWDGEIVSLGLRKQPEGLVGVLSYNQKIWSRSHAAEFAARLRQVLAACVRDPRRRLSQIRGRVGG
jgi:Condensation domain